MFINTTTIQVPIQHRDVDFIMYVDEYHVYPGEPMKWPSMDDPGHPGCGPELEIISGSLEIDVDQDNQLAKDIKKQFMESDRLFWIIVNEQMEHIEQYLTEGQMDDEYPFDPRDYEWGEE